MAGGPYMSIALTGSFGGKRQSRLPVNTSHRPEITYFILALLKWLA